MKLCEVIKIFENLGFSKGESLRLGRKYHYGIGMEIAKYRVEKRGDKWCTIHCSGPDEGKVIKCFDTKKAAMSQHKAIQAKKQGYSKDGKLYDT